MCNSYCCCILFHPNTIIMVVGWEKQQQQTNINMINECVCAWVYVVLNQFFFFQSCSLDDTSIRFWKFNELSYLAYFYYNIVVVIGANRTSLVIQLHICNPLIDNVLFIITNKRRKRWRNRKSRKRTEKWNKEGITKMGSQSRIEMLEIQ